MGWEDEKRWSDRFIPEIKSILGQILIGEASQEEDMKRNTDLIVLRMEAVRIACRVRRFKYLENYGDEFTIRCNSQENAKTELHKVISGWGDVFFYGFCDESETRLAKWIVGDLSVFRFWFTSYCCRNQGFPPGEKRENRDGTALRSFCVSDLPSDFVIKQGRLEQVAA